MTGKPALEKGLLNLGKPVLLSPSGAAGVIIKSISEKNLYKFFLIFISRFLGF
jgi:hypothetical protein